ncbi:hypothetical protein BJX63DRAFT_427335 [Aspergillus granulosus]|uniref:Uncharacterized protein n=1 Tax=Aspergillus granulosus TaxID=176169 RepID=A0ABR4I2L9_9EURO
MCHFHSSQTFQDSTTLGRFQLAKFSYAINSKNSKGPFTWSHVYGNNELVGIFESYADPLPGNIIFKIIRNDAVLEEVNLTELARELKNQTQGKSATSIVSLVVRRPCLAMKFPLSNDRAYRFQIMFSSDGDYCSALAILREMKCVFVEMNATSGRQSSRLGSSHLASSTGLSSSSENIMPSVSMAQPYTSNPAINSFSNRSLSSSASSSATLAKSSPTFSTLDSSNAPPTAATTIPEVALPPSNDWNKELPTRPFTAIVQRNFEDLDLPPKRDLPFLKPAPKRTRKAPESADAMPSKTPRTGPRSNPKTTTKSRGKTASRTTPSASESVHREEDTSHATTATAGTQTDMEPLKSSSAYDSHSTTALTRFLFHTEEERHAMLQKLFCDLLNDNAFTQLCVDVEGTWTRMLTGK